MKNHKQIYFLIFIIFSIFLSNFIASKINISLGYTSIIGEYSQKNYHPINDFFKYFIYIFLPIFTFIAVKFYFDKKIFINLLSNLRIKTKLYSPDKVIHVFLVITIFLLILEFLSIEFPLSKIDFFHEGQKLSGAYKNVADGSLWSGSYVVVGIIYEVLNTKLIWKITGHETIGSARFIDLIYVLTSKILLVFLAFQISKFINLSKNFKILFFITFSFFLTQQIDYNIFSADTIAFREIPVILILILFFKSIVSYSRIYLALISLLIISTFFWSIDRALVLLFFSFSIYLYLIINKKYIEIGFLLISKFFFIMIFFLLLDYEFKYFASNTINVIKEHTYVNGLIHPDLFTNDKNSFRATKNIIAIILSLMISTNLLFHENKKFDFNIRLILISLSIISFLSYSYSIGRSDGPHLKQSFGFLYIFFLLYILNYILFKFQNYFKDNNIQKNIMTIFIFLFLFSHIKNYNFSNIYNFDNRLKNFITLSDDKFLDEQDKIFVSKASDIFKNEKCIQLLTNDAALYYLLKKTHCSKYYFVYSVGSNLNQKKFISEIKNTNYVILGGKTDNWSFLIKKKYPIISDYIASNYILYKGFSNRFIFSKN